MSCGVWQDKISVYLSKFIFAGLGGEVHSCKLFSELQSQHSNRTGNDTQHRAPVAQLIEHRAVNTQDRKITEEKVLPL